MATRWILWEWCVRVTVAAQNRSRDWIISTEDQAAWGTEGKAGGGRWRKQGSTIDPLGNMSHSNNSIP